MKRILCLGPPLRTMGNVTLRQLNFRRLSTMRPDINFDFLLDDANLDAIRKNIQERKGVGDIDALCAKWNNLQQIIEGKDKPKLSEAQFKAIWDELYEEALRLPNMSNAEVPKGGAENVKELETFGEKKEGKCATAEQLVKTWRSLFHPTEAAGQRSYAFIGPLANLENVLMEYVFERAVALDFKPITVPDIVSKDVTEACGVQQTSNQSIQYTLNGEPDVALSGTSEMGIAAFLRGRTFEQAQLPVRLVSYSRCFRPEISKSANEAKLYRVHEFFKVEMFIVCTPEQSAAELDYIVQVQKGTFKSLGLHCRLLEMPSEELGASAARKIDIEAWMPGRGIWGEISSASNCTDFQARRLNCKYKTSTGEIKPVHTCNGTAVASTRAMIALLETYQTEKKGLGELPEVIRNRLKTQRPPPLRFHTGKSAVEKS